MSETNEEKLDRLRAMCDPKQQTWDLSENDVAAISMAVGIIDNVSDHVGRLADKADNLLAASTLPVSPAIHIQGLKGGLQEIRDEAQELYRSLGGDE